MTMVSVNLDLLIQHKHVYDYVIYVPVYCWYIFIYDLYYVLYRFGWRTARRKAHGGAHQGGSEDGF